MAIHRTVRSNGSSGTNESDRLPIREPFVIADLKSIRRRFSEFVKLDSEFDFFCFTHVEEKDKKKSK